MYRVTIQLFLKKVSVNPNNVKGEIKIIKIDDPRIGARKVLSATFVNIGFM